MPEIQYKPSTPKHKTTQSYLQIFEIREDLLVMNDGTLRAVLAVSSSNFDLKNEDEQNAIIAGYQRFLNSIDTRIQILIQSRKLEISNYIAKLKDIMNQQTNELLRVQTGEYIEFISRLVESASIMSKHFYVIIPYDYSIFPQTSGLLGGLLGGNTASQQTKDRLESFSKYKKILEDRVTGVSSALESVGLRTIRLNSQQLIELLYNSYNFESGPLLDASKLGDISLVDEPK